MFGGKPPGGGNGIPLGMFGGGWPFANGGGKGGIPLPPAGIMGPFGPGPCMPNGGGGMPAPKLVEELERAPPTALTWEAWKWGWKSRTSLLQHRVCLSLRSV